MADDIAQMIENRFAELPESVRRAVTDASVEQKLRALAQKYKLHLDQWVLLENEIMLTLLGLEEPEAMAANVGKEVGVDKELAQQIVNDIAVEIFQPIREQLQSGLQTEGERRPTVDVSVPERVTTPERKKEAIDTLLNKTKKEEPADTAAYRPGQSSAERRDVQEDPYRESIDSL